MSTVEGTRSLFDEADVAAAARVVADEARRSVVERDRLSSVPVAEAKLLAASGLLALRNPIGSGVVHRPSVVIDAARVIATSDPSLAQIVQNHYVPVEVLTHWGFPDSTRARIFADVAAGVQLSTASAPKTFGVGSPADARTVASTSGARVLSGSKYFVTGAFNAGWLFVTASDAGSSELRHRLVVPTSHPGVELVDDWDSVGQRGTGSGTVRFHDVEVGPDYFVTAPPTRQSWFQPFTQAIHSALLVGLIRSAFDDGVAFATLRHQADTSGARNANPFTAAGFGRLSAKVAAAESLLTWASSVVDEVDLLGGHTAARSDYDRANVAALQARTFAADVALEVGEKIIELGGAHAALTEFGLDRHWRNARTHTLQRSLASVDAGIGAYFLEGENPSFGI